MIILYNLIEEENKYTFNIKSERDINFNYQNELRIYSSRCPEFLKKSAIYNSVAYLFTCGKDETADDMPITVDEPNYILITKAIEAYNLLNKEI